MGCTPGLLIGSAFVLAHGLAHGELSDGDRRDRLGDLWGLAGGDRTAIVAAQARYREFLVGPSPTTWDHGAFALLEAALADVDGQAPRSPTGDAPFTAGVRTGGG